LARGETAIIRPDRQWAWTLTRRSEKGFNDPPDFVVCRSGRPELWRKSWTAAEVQHHRPFWLMTSSNVVGNCPATPQDR
jgi:hypothetical protein